VNKTLFGNRNEAKVRVKKGRIYNLKTKNFFT